VTTAHFGTYYSIAVKLSIFQCDIMLPINQLQVESLVVVADSGAAGLLRIVGVSLNLSLH